MTATGVLFVEREHERQLYLEFLAQDSPWILFASGLGGSGKSELLYKLKEQTPATACVTPLNLAPETVRTDGLKILDKIATSVAPYCDEQRFKTFKRKLDAGRIELAKSSKVIIQQLSVTGNATAKDNLLNLNLADPMREKRHLVWSRVTDELFSLIDTFRLDQLVLLVDNCEWVCDQEIGTAQSLDVGQWLFDDLLPELHDHLHGLEQGKRLSVVIASSIKPEFHDFRTNDQRTWDVNILNKEGTHHYLEQFGMVDPNLREYVYEHMTHGHAHSLKIAAELYRELLQKQEREQKKQPLAFADRAELRSLFNEQAFMRFIKPDIINKYLKTSYLRDLIHYGVLLRSFNQPLLEAVFSEWLPAAEAFDRFHKLISYSSYIENIEIGRFSFIALLREVATEYIREQERSKWEYYHQQALNYLHEARSIDWYFHNLAYNSEQGIKDWKQAVEQIDIHAAETYLYHEALIEAICDVALKLPMAACAERAYQRGRFYARNRKWEAAQESYSEALLYYQRLHDTMGEALTRQAIAGTERD